MKKNGYLKPREAKALIGKKVVWEETLCRNRGTYRLRKGVLEEVRGNNARIGESSWQWLPKMENLREDDAE